MSNQIFEKKLLAMKEELEKELGLLGRKISDSGDWIVVLEDNEGSKADPVDNADIAEEYEEKLAVLNVLEERYQQVSKALLAIKNGTYGICEVSSKKIPKARLMADPSVTTCVEHAS